MRMLTVITAVVVAAVRAAFGLEGGLHRDEICPEPMEHILDHMVGPNAENLASDFSRHVPISQMPGKAHQLVGICMSDFDEPFGRSLDL